MELYRITIVYFRIVLLDFVNIHYFLRNWYQIHWIGEGKSRVSICLLVCEHNLRTRRDTALRFQI